MDLKILAPIVIIGISLGVISVFFLDDSSNATIISSPTHSELQIMETSGVKHSIPLDKIKGGGPPKDGIPSIDNPVFVGVDDSRFMSNSDIVIGLEINGESKAYPIFILVWHEIVNDIVGDVPVSVTYCPLCYTNQVFERTIDGTVVEFGTSGKLYNSNLLMYDRFTESYWSQALGVAVKGELTGYQLDIIPFDVISWGDWKILHPETLVLTTDTGYIRSYATDPYGNYYTEPGILFPVEYSDDRLNPKEIILGFHIGDVYKAYKQADVELFSIINDEISDSSIMLVSLYDDNTRTFSRVVDGNTLDFEYEDNEIIDSQTDSVWNYDGLSISGPLSGMQLERLAFSPGFWFEWVAFHPDTLVYGVE